MSTDLKLLASLQSPHSLIDTLSDQSISKTETEWTLRLKALQSIQDFISQETTTLALFLDTYKNLTLHLTVQLKDLRSAIVKEAIKVLTIAACKFRSNFDTVICRLLDTIFNLVSSTTNAISKSANEAIKAFMENIYSAKVLAKVLENVKQKNVAIKFLCSECLFYALQSFPKSILDLVEADSLSLAIKSFLCESGKIRDKGKDCFLAFTDKYPEKSDKCIQMIGSVSKKLAEELRALKRTFDIDLVTEFPANVEISAEEWAIFEKMDMFEAIRLAVTETSFQTPMELQLEAFLEKSDNQVRCI
jgi:hypothetical protein